jgi:aspartate/methionine/tyrosine aminotransferase
MEGLKGVRPEDSLTYAPSFGILPLRKAWQDSLFQKNPGLLNKKISLPVVTCGITHALSMFADMWIDPGDVVILPDMMWGNYNMILGVRRGARVSQYPIFNQQGGFNLEAFEKKVQQEAKNSNKIVVLLNFPNNPTGYTVTKEEGEGITQILSRVAQEGKNIIAAFDDAYFGLFYEEETLKESLFARLCDSHKRLLAVKLDGATKENYVWGLRVGFVTYGCKTDETAESFYDALERKTAGCVRGNISNNSHLGQSVVLKSILNNSFVEEKQSKFDVLKKRANRVKEVISDPKYKHAWNVYPFNSGYFMCIQLKDIDAETLRSHLLEKYGVGLIALGDKNIRIAFSCLEIEDIPELFDIILKGVQDLT